MKLTVSLAFIFVIGVVVGTKLEVTTSVVSEKPFVTLTCQIQHPPSSENLRRCTFVDPSGKELTPAGRYKITPTAASGVQTCTLQIEDPVVADLGIWRCAVETTSDSYYGFLPALSPWAMSDPEVAAQVDSEPKLSANTPSVSTLEDSEVKLSCYVPSAARYCHFRSQSGRVFIPGSTDGTEYIGKGLDAGECGIRFPRLSARDSGDWSCHVGLLDSTQPEQKTSVRVDIEALISASQYHIDNDQYTLVVQAQVHGQSPLQYCRFVRIDGLGFTSENLPTGYEDHSLLKSGRCEIRIQKPSVLEQHPWTMAAKVTGEDQELVETTEHTISMPEEEEEKECGGGRPNRPNRPNRPDNRPDNRPSRGGPWFFIRRLLILVGVSAGFFVIGWLLGSRKSRNLVASFRNSFSKKPLPDLEVTKTVDASMAA